MKKFLSSVLAVVMLLAMTTTAFAAVSDTGFSDVAASDWFAGSAVYVRDNGLMTGTTPTTFNPNGTTSRGQIAAILYRASGSPADDRGTVFPDVADTAYYAAASRWASANSIVTGYTNGNFGPNDPITRQQLAAILWRYAGSPSASRGQDYADEGTISSYASTAVDWARDNGIITGKTGNLFDPNGRATRAQAAVILHRYMELIDSGKPETPDAPDTPSGSRVLVAYFSGSGNTEAVAESIADTLDADIFEITPVDPYTDADLNWTVSTSRVNREHENEALRDIELVADTADNWDDYDIVFIGYPIWWGIAAWPVNGFVEANDFSGKTVIPFCTSTSSGLGQSGELLEEMAANGNWLEGHRFSERPSQADIQNWIDSLDI